MNFLRGLWATFTGSFYSKELYANPPKASRSLFVLGLLAALTALQISVIAGASIAAFAQQNFLSSVVDTYPKELVIHVKDGVASANVAQPYYIDMPASLQQTASTTHLAVIDTREGTRLEQISKYDALVVLTRT